MGLRCIGGFSICHLDRVLCFFLVFGDQQRGDEFDEEDGGLLESQDWTGW